MSENECEFREDGLDLPREIEKDLEKLTGIPEHVVKQNYVHVNNLVESILNTTEPGKMRNSIVYSCCMILLTEFYTRAGALEMVQDIKEGIRTTDQEDFAR